MNPKNPQAASEYVLVPREPTEAMLDAATSASMEAEEIYSENRGPDVWERFGLRKNRILHQWRALLAAAPAITPAGNGVDELRHLYRAYVDLLESGRNRIMDFGGTCDPVDVMEKADPHLVQVRNFLAALAPAGNAGAVDDAMAAVDWLVKQVGGRTIRDELLAKQAGRTIAAALAPAAASGGDALMKCVCGDPKDGGGCTNKCDRGQVPPLPTQTYTLKGAPADPPAAGAWTADADQYGNALNEAAWTFVDVCPEKSALLFNNTKQALRAAILKYAEVVAAQEAARG